MLSATAVLFDVLAAFIVILTLCAAMDVGTGQYASPFEFCPHNMTIYQRDALDCW
jgi:hypothetical protein